MHSQIKSSVKTLKLQYYLFWLLPVLVIVLHESDWLPVGMYADNPGNQYILETIGILLAIILVPLSLKYFNVILKKKIDEAEFSVALQQYKIWNGVRLTLLEIVVLFNIIVYYLTLDNIGSLCALIGLAASIFCLPGKKRLKRELNIYTEKDE